MIKRIIFLIAAVSLVLTSCSSNEQPVAEGELGIVKSRIAVGDDNSLAAMPVYATTQPGESVRLDRAFENAPPMIPHTTEGFFPITIKSNLCLSCHMPDKAEAVKAIPLPLTHFADLRPEIIADSDGKLISDANPNVVSVVSSSALNNAYFNCSQCHVPQADVTVDIENRFTPEFRDIIGNRRSNLSETVREGVK